MVSALPALAPWLAAAVATIAGFVTGRPGGIPLLPSSLDPFERGGLALPFGIAGIGERAGERRRRRRRRALTNSDRDDIAFIAATISKSAAGSFAVQLVTRSR